MVEGTGYQAFKAVKEWEHGSSLLRQSDWQLASHIDTALDDGTAAGAQYIDVCSLRNNSGSNSSSINTVHEDADDTVWEVWSNSDSGISAQGGPEVEQEVFDQRGCLFRWPYIVETSIGRRDVDDGHEACHERNVTTEGGEGQASLTGTTQVDPEDTRMAAGRQFTEDISTTSNSSSSSNSNFMDENVGADLERFTVPEDSDSSGYKTRTDVSDNCREAEIAYRFTIVEQFVCSNPEMSSGNYKDISEADEAVFDERKVARNSICERSDLHLKFSSGSRNSRDTIISTGARSICREATFAYTPTARNQFVQSSPEISKSSYVQK